MYYAIETRQGSKIRITRGVGVGIYRRALGVRTYAAADARRVEVQNTYPDRPVVVVQFANDEEAINYCASYN